MEAGAGREETRAGEDAWETRSRLFGRHDSASAVFAAAVVFCFLTPSGSSSGSSMRGRFRWDDLARVPSGTEVLFCFLERSFLYPGSQTRWRLRRL
jgi:hypothetical protein